MNRVSSGSLIATLLFSMSFVCRGQATDNIQPLSPNAGSASDAIARRQGPHVQTDAIQLQNDEWVIPELIIGGEWTSTIRLTNRGTTAIPPTNVYFVDNMGNPMQTTFRTTAGNIVTGTGFSFFAAVGGMAEATFVGGTNTVFGHAIIGCSTNGCGTPGLYGEVTLRNHNATRPDFEAVFPLEQPAGLQYMLWDGRNGLTTMLYLDNEGTSPTTVSLDLRDINNTVVRTLNIPLPAMGSQILMTLQSLAPETIGTQGTIVIRSPSTALITATGLRINPTNSFTPLRAFVEGF
jgi:hypothetical protein